MWLWELNRELLQQKIEAGLGLALVNYIYKVCMA